MGAHRQKDAAVWLVILAILGAFVAGLSGCGGPGPLQRSDELRMLERGLSRAEWNRYRLTHPETH